MPGVPLSSGKDTGRGWEGLARALAIGLLLSALPVEVARGAPDVDGSLDALLDTPTNTLGDAVGAAGLITAGFVGLVGDGVGLLDDNRYSRVVLRGFVSGLVNRIGLVLSWTATGALEGLRAEDIQRLPEAQATYLDAVPGAGHVDTIVDGLATGALAIEDALLNPVLCLLRATGLQDPGDRVQARLEDSRNRALGPLAP